MLMGSQSQPCLTLFKFVTLCNRRAGISEIPNTASAEGIRFRPMNRRRVLVALGTAGIVGLLSGCFPDGTYGIGNAAGQVKPGLYTSTTVLGGDCRIDRTIANQPFSDFGIESNGGRNFIELPAGPHQFIVSRGCGVWVTPKSTSYKPDRATAKFGEYRVPTDLLPGTYVAPGAPGCAWQLLSDFTSNPSSILSTTFETPGKQPRVTIASADAGFSSNPCGGWKRVVFVKPNPLTPKSK